tara:strand:- start:1006 stop:1845 length:840 start_codon:yes stop_codon:yes gene_type:complete
MSLLSKGTSIAIFAYNRPSHLRRLLISLENYNIEKAYVFLDGPKNEKEKIVQNEIITMVKYNKNIKLKLIKKNKNIGLAKSIISGVTNLSNRYKNIIILEDDCIPRREFFIFIKNLTNNKNFKYSKNPICGYQLPEIHNKANKFFPLYLKYFIPWGWFISSEIWKKFIKFLKIHKSIKINDKLFNKIKKISKNKVNNIWSLQFIKFNLYNKTYIIFPNISLIKNIGFDGSGINSKITNKLNTRYKKINIKKNEYFNIFQNNKLQKQQTTVLSKRVGYFY